MKILINTISSKRNAGGGFQISLNFIKHSLYWKDSSIEWFYFVSEDIDKQLQNDRISIVNNYYVFPTQPNLHSYLKVRKEIRIIEEIIIPDVIYSITAPSYFTFKSKEVMRFTNPWVSHPNEYSWNILSLKERIKMKLYIFLQKLMLKKAEYFITQTNLVKTNLIKLLNLPNGNIKVVPNVLPAAFLNENREHVNNEDNCIHIACVANSSKHKNLDIIPAVAKVLADKHQIQNVVFHLTISKESQIWRIIQLQLHQYGIHDRVITHGRIDQKKLADIYRHCDLAFIPTLLEVFSASGLEAAYFNLPIVATDFQFNREVYEDGCLYYKPYNAEDAADKIADLINNLDSYIDNITPKNKRIVSMYGNYDEHFEAICDFLKTISKC